MGTNAVPVASNHRALRADEIARLESAGCASDDWSRVLVTHDFLPKRMRDVRLVGDIRLGRFHGDVRCAAGLSKPAGIYHAHLLNCTIRDDVRIANIGSHIANYEIGDGACVEDVGVLQTSPGATFGAGLQVAALNEAGGREVTLFNELTAQFAYLQGVVRWRPKFTERMNAIARAAAVVHRDIGTIERGARISSVGRIEDVRVGAYAIITGSLAITNGTILSCKEAPTFVGPGVMAEDFLLAEGANVCSGTFLSASFVGQGCKMGKQFSAEGSLFFANCDAFQGEACSAFAGPYTQTHHKSTLLIASLSSFFNAGSGTNQSNHMYKVGPVHEGKFERGCKTGSNSYLRWPCRVGPYSVVLGKHARRFDTRDFPFRRLEATPEGRCELVPGICLTNVGTVRDDCKWPARDRRAAGNRRDRIDYDVFSPFTVGRMLRGLEKLRDAAPITKHSSERVLIDGADVRRAALEQGIDYFRACIEMYLQENIMRRVENARERGITDLHQAFAVDLDSVFCEEWLDLAGQMIPRGRLDALCDAVESGEIDTARKLDETLGAYQEAYAHDEWAWVVWAHEKHFDRPINSMSASDLTTMAKSWRTTRAIFLERILHDAQRDFDDRARAGFGPCFNSAEKYADFTAVRGTLEADPYVAEIRAELEEVERRVARFLNALSSASPT